MTNLRTELLARVKRVVVKVGTRLVTGSGGLDHIFLERLCAEITDARKIGLEVVVVSSGAVGLGMVQLGLHEKPRRLDDKQACAAIGQIRLVHAWQEALGRRGVVAAQMLLTADDFREPERFGNLRRTTQALLRAGAVPVINENDTVATAEIRLGDNDKLSADVACYLDADLLVILTDTAGLYTANPKTHPEAVQIPVVQRVDASIEALAGGTGGSNSTGGMITKVQAARQVTESGLACLVADGRTASFTALLSGQPTGTLFLPGPVRLGARKRWIAFVGRPLGRLVCDEGAVRAVTERRASLLPRGVRAVEGRFSAGALVDLCNPGGRPFARGLVSFASKEAALLAGCDSREIPSLLGRATPQELVHRDNLFVLSGEA